MGEETTFSMQQIKEILKLQDYYLIYYIIIQMISHSIVKVVGHPPRPCWICLLPCGTGLTTVLVS